VGVFVAPSIAFAQRSKAVRRIGVLDFPDSPEQLRGQAEALREVGWVEGQNLHIERRVASDGQLETLKALAEELVRAKVEIIVTDGTLATLAAKRATTTIPIVMRSSGDAVLLGLVPSLARPGGNVTGYTGAGPEMIAKSLSLLKELLPRLHSVGVLWEGAHPYFRATRGQFEDASQSLGLEAVFVESVAAGQFGKAIAQLARERVQALVLPNSSLVKDHDVEIIDAAMKHGLPTMCEDEEMVRKLGALIAYTTTQAEEDLVCAEFIDQILRGARPADLPVRQPTKFLLAINLKTARVLGITVPQSFLVRANEVIQ
jgi:putative ABC transport system substrate-binding protein